MMHWPGGGVVMAVTMLLCYYYLIIVVTARPSIDGFVHDVRRPLLRGNYRYNPFKQLFNKENGRNSTLENLLTKNNITSRKLDDVSQNVKCLFYVLSNNVSKQISVKNNAKLSYVKICADNKTQIFFSPVNTTDKFLNKTFGLTKLNITVNNPNIIPLLNFSGIETDKRFSLFSQAIKKLFAEKSKTNNIMNLNEVVNNTDQSIIKSLNFDSNDKTKNLIKDFVTNSLSDFEWSNDEVRNEIKKDGSILTTDLSLSESLDNLILSHTNSKNPIQMFPQNAPPKWTDKPIDPSVIIIEDGEPSLAPMHNPNLHNLLEHLVSAKPKPYRPNNYYSSTKPPLPPIPEPEPPDIWSSHRPRPSKPPHINKPSNQIYVYPSDPYLEPSPEPTPLYRPVMLYPKPEPTSKPIYVLNDPPSNDITSNYKPFYVYPKPEPTPSNIFNSIPIIPKPEPTIPVSKPILVSIPQTDFTSNPTFTSSSFLPHPIYKPIHTYPNIQADYPQTHLPSYVSHQSDASILLKPPLGDTIILTTPQSPVLTPPPAPSPPSIVILDPYADQPLDDPVPVNQIPAGNQTNVAQAACGAVQVINNVEFRQNNPMNNNCSDINVVINAPVSGIIDDGSGSYEESSEEHHHDPPTKKPAPSSSSSDYLSSIFSGLTIMSPITVSLVSLFLGPFAFLIIGAIVLTGFFLPFLLVRYLLGGILGNFLNLKRSYSVVTYQPKISAAANHFANSIQKGINRRWE